MAMAGLSIFAISKTEDRRRYLDIAEQAGEEDPDTRVLYQRRAAAAAEARDSALMALAGVGALLPITCAIASVYGMYHLALEAMVLMRFGHHQPPPPHDPSPPAVVIALPQRASDPGEGRGRAVECGDTECCICLDQPPDVILDPCGHIVVCRTCTLRMWGSSARVCPKCQRAVISWAKVEDV